MIFTDYKNLRTFVCFVEINQILFFYRKMFIRKMVGIFKDSVINVFIGEKE